MTKAKQSELAKIRALDQALLEIVEDFLFLGPLSWSKSVMSEFLTQIDKKNMILPTVTYPKLDYKEKIQDLQKYLKKLESHDLEHPAIFFLKETAESYLDAYYLLQGIGTSDVTHFSKKMYGSPRESLPGYKRRNIEIARYFLRVVEGYRFTVPDEPLIYNTQQFKRALAQQLVKVIDPDTDPIAIHADAVISARVAAGPNYVKIRKNTRFSEADLNQLLHHEVFVHTLTFLNGRRQPVLKMLGQNSPRIVGTQEGLAVFAEYINRSIELVRLKRIALRIIAIDMAEKGADLVDLFRFYQSHDQNDEESYYSAMRIFRGGYPKGGIVFYKDNVYLRGLIEVESFLKQVMHSGMIHDIDLLFCGKLTTQDVLRLQPLEIQGYVLPPKYLPTWAKESSELAAHLAFNDLTERFRL